MIFLIKFFLSSLVLFSISSFSTESNPISPELLNHGRQIFLQNCMTCHGIQGEGNGPAAKVMNPKPRNFRKDPFKFGNNPQRIFTTITAGIDGTPMPSWKDLPETDRWAVAYYVSSLAGKKISSSKTKSNKYK